MSVEVRRARSGFLVTFPYDRQLVALMRDVPGAEWDRQKKAWRVPYDVHAVRPLLDEERFGKVKIADEVEEWLASAVPHLNKLLDIRTTDPDIDLLYEYESRLYHFQRTMVEFMVTAENALNSDQMGLGKTIETIAAIREMELRYDIEQMYLIVCPNSMKHTWAAELERWYPADFELYMPGSVRDSSALASREPGFYIVNWEKTWRMNDLLLTPWEICVGDESHRMKNRKTKQAVAMHHIKARHRFLLTGTPLKNQIMDLWSQLNFLEPERWTSYWKFFDRYADWRENFMGHKEVVGIRNPDELNQRLTSIMFGRSLDDVEIELPPVIKKRIKVDLGKEQRKVYNQMRDEFVAYIGAQPDEEEVISSNWLSQVLRLKQIAGSLGIFSETSRQSAKIDALFDLMEEAPGEKFIVMTQFRGMVNEVTERLRDGQIPFCELTGESCYAWTVKSGERKAPNRQELIDYFQNSDTPRVFIATTQTGGEGITLTAARYFCFLDLLWTPGDNEQAWKRVHRVGQTRTCFVYEILAADTIDYSGILPKLRSKQAIIDAVMHPDNGKESNGS